MPSRIGLTLCYARPYNLSTGGDPATPKQMTNTVQIQSVGRVAGKPAGELKPGDLTVWNFGYTHTVVRIVRETKAQVIVEFDGGWIKRMGKTRLVAMVSRK